MMRREVAALGRRRAAVKRKEVLDRKLAAAVKAARGQRASLVSHLAAEAATALSNEMLLSWWASGASHFTHGGLVDLPPPAPPPPVPVSKPLHVSTFSDQAARGQDAGARKAAARAAGSRTLKEALEEVEEEMLEVVASMRGAARAARREARRERAALVSRLAAEARVALSSEMLLSWWACEAAYFEAASHGRVLLPSPFWSPPPRVSLFKPSNSQGLGVPKTSQSGSPLFRIHILTPPYANRLAFSEWKSELTLFVSLDHCVQFVKAVIAKSTGFPPSLLPVCSNSGSFSSPPLPFCFRLPYFRSTTYLRWAPDPP